MKLSIIVPCFNEAENVLSLQKAVIEAFQDHPVPFELIFVDDGSQDATLHNLKKLYQCQKCPMKIISFSRNFGKEAAIYAGLEQAQGEYISILDADMQQDPKMILQMLEILETNPETDVVAACQDRKNESKMIAFLKKRFYTVINRLSDVRIPADAGDFRTFRKSVAESLLSLAETHRFSKGLFAWVGYQTEYLTYTAEPRKHGKSKWGIRKLFSYALEGIVGFSTKPLRIAAYIGSFTAFAAMLYLIAVISEKLFWGIDVPGYATTVALVLLLGGIQLFCLGIMGEYIGKIFEQSKQRPIYIAKEIIKNETE